MQTTAEDKGLLRRFRLGKGELWALGAALSYALYQVFLRVAVRGDELNSMVGATVQAIPILLFSVAMSWFVKRRDRGTVSPLSDWKLIGALVANGLLLFVVATPLLFAALREGGVLITSPLTSTQVLWAALGPAARPAQHQTFAARRVADPQLRVLSGRLPRRERTDLLPRRADG